MTSSNPHRGLRVGVLFAAMAQVLWPAAAAAQSLPSGVVDIVTNGSGATNISTQGTTTTVTASNGRTLINWNTFNVANGYTFDVVVGNSADLVVNRVIGGSGTTINGLVTSHVGSSAGAVGGHVWILNPSGIVVGGSARFNVGGMLLSTAGLADLDVLDGDRSFHFSGTGGMVSVQGGAQLQAHTGSIIVHAERVDSLGRYIAADTNALLASRELFVTFDANFNPTTTLELGAGSSVANALNVGGQFSGNRTLLTAGGMTSAQGNVLLGDYGTQSISFSSGDVEITSRDGRVEVLPALQAPRDLTITAGQTIRVDRDPIIGRHYAVTAQDWLGAGVLHPLFYPGSGSRFSITDTAGGLTRYYGWADGDLTITTLNGGNLHTGGLTSANGNVVLNASGELRVSADVTAHSTGAISLSGASIIQDAGILRAGSVTANSWGLLALNADNQFSRGWFNAGGAIFARSVTSGVLFDSAVSSSGNVTLSAINGMRLDGSTVRAENGSVVVNGPVVLTGANTVSSTYGTVTFNGTLDSGDLAATTLDVASTAGTTFAQDVGATSALGFLRVTGAARFNGNLANVFGGFHLGEVTVGGSGGAFNFYGAGMFRAGAVSAPGRNLGIQSLNGIQAASISAGDFAGGVYRDVVLNGAGIVFGGGSAGSYATYAQGSLDVTGALTTRRLSGDIGGTARLDHAGNRIDAIGAFVSSGLSLRTAEGTVVDGLVDGRTHDVSIRGASPTSTIRIASTGQVRGLNVDLSGGTFVNDSGADAIQAGGHWVVYQTTMSSLARYDGLDSGTHAIWGQTIDTLAPSSITGNRYVFAHRPVLTFTTLDASKVYGTALGGTPSSHYAVSGYMPGVAGAYLADAAANVFSGTPVVASAGFAERASVAGGPYVITAAAGSLTSLSGYDFAFSSAGRLTVTPKDLIGTPTANSKIYDGTTAGTGSIALSGIVSGDAVGATGTFTFVDRNAGIGKTVTLTGATLTGADAGNYTLTVPASTIADILQRAINATATVNTKTYDGTTNGTGSITLSGVLAGDSVAAGGTFTFADKNAGTSKQVTLSGVVLSGADAGNYSLTVPSSLLGEILRRAITGTVAVDTKVYDGTTAATATVALDGAVAGDAVSGSATFLFGDKHAGAGKVVTVTGAALSGADAGNYTLTLPASALGEILRRALTGTPTVAAKTYDGTTGATGAIALSGVVPGDVVAAGGTFAFEDKNAGTGKVVTLSGVTLSGADAGNYTLSVPASVLGDILQKALTGVAVVDAKTYDGTTAATGRIAVSGVVAGDVVGADGVFTFSDRNAGAGKTVTISGVSLHGADAGNYTLSVPASTVGEILRRALTGTATVNAKIYDGTTAGSGAITLNGVITGDSVGATGTYTFSDANAGTAKTVVVGGVSLTGADAGNYTVVVPGTTVADILRRAITVTAHPVSKQEGSVDPALGYGVTQGSLVAGDSLTGALARAPGEAPGSYSIGQGTLDASANYQLTFVGSTLTITEVPADPTPALVGTDDLGGVVRFLEGGGESSVARRRVSLDIVDERAPCDPATRETATCETGRPE